MSLIKIPQSSLDFFKKNQDEIFESGNLAEDPWNKKLSEKRVRAPSTKTTQESVTRKIHTPPFSL